MGTALVDSFHAGKCVDCLYSRPGIVPAICANMRARELGNGVEYWSDGCAAFERLSLADAVRKSLEDAP